MLPVPDHETPNAMRIRGWPRSDAVGQSPACAGWTSIRKRTIALTSAT